MIKFTELKNNKRNDLKSVIPLKKPYTLLIEPSSVCNFSCKMCFQSAHKQGEFKNKKSLMDIDCFNKIIEQVKTWEGPKIKVLKLSLYGEPLLNKHFSEMLSIAKSADIAERIETTTNASLLDEVIAKKLIDNEIDYIRVSIYSVNQEKHKEITKNDISIEKIFRNLKRLQELKKKYNKIKPFIAVKMLDTFSEENEIFIDKYKDIADEIYIDQPHNWVQPEDETFIDKLYGEKPDIKKIKRSACPMPFTTLAIRSNGEVAPCCIDWYGGTNLGDIYEQKLQKIWEGKSLYDFQVMQLERRNYENVSCRNCEFYLNPYYCLDDIDGLSVEKLNKPI